ncbi:MAG: TetR/AcrR family transcriptional regulator [Pseudomonadota bacterium]
MTNSAETNGAAPETDKPNRVRIIDAALMLAAEMPWNEIRVSDVAERAGLSLREVRTEFSSRTGILLAYAKDVDLAVLDRIDPEMAEEPHHDRLLDILITRFEVLRPHRVALSSILEHLPRDPRSLSMWNGETIRSMKWMLEAAGIDTSGTMGGLRAQGLVFVYLRAMRVFLDDDDPGMARTMAELDRRLRRGARQLDRASAVLRAGDAFRNAMRSSRRRRRARDDWDDDPAADGFPAEGAL